MTIYKKPAIYAILALSAIGFSAFRYQSVTGAVNHKRIEFIETKMLWGTWRSEADKEAVLVIKPSKCFDYYGKRVIDTLRYKIGNSCNADEDRRQLDLGNAYLTFYNADSSYTECNEILNLDKNTLCYRNNATGKIHVFKKVLAQRK